MPPNQDWNTYFMNLAHYASYMSRDPDTRVGAVIVSANNDVVSTGFNRFGQGVEESERRWRRPAKYDYVTHAEVCAIAGAARRGVSTDECTIYLTMAPCLSCTKLIMAAGIHGIVADRLLDGWTGDQIRAMHLYKEDVRNDIEILSAATCEEADYCTDDEEIPF